MLAFVRTLGVCFSLSFFFLGSPALAHASDRPFQISIPAGNLAGALEKLGDQSGLQIMYEPEVARGIRVAAVNGTITASEALTQLLARTGLEADRVNDKTVVLRRAKTKEAEPAEKEQDEPSTVNRPAQEYSEKLDEIVVTARKKAAGESAQDVPIAITALSGAQLELLHADNLTAVGRLIPNVLLTNNGNTPSTQNFQIRGMGLFSSVPSDEPTVGLFTDGMYLGVNLGASTDLFDLESVEVLRGPQGTLFGRNVTGGAVLLRSRLPTGDFAGRFRATLGTHDQRDFAFAIENALSSKVAGKLAVLTQSRDGYWKNLAIPGNRVGGDKSAIIKPILTFKPSDSVEIDFIGEYGDQDAGALNTRLISDHTGSGALPAPHPSENMSHNEVSDSTLKWKHGIVETNVDIGKGKLTSVTGYRTLKNSGGGDIDGSAAPIFRADFELNQDQVSEELRYAAPLRAALDYTVGVYYFHQDYVYSENRNLLNGAVLQAMQGAIKHAAYAAFAQGTFAFNEQWSATVGARYSGETKDAEVFSVGECTFDFSSCIGGFSEKKSWSFPNGHADLAWKPSADLLLYASWGSSFRSGGFTVRNFSPTTPPGPYDQEEVSAYEVGLKSDLAGGRIRLNASVFNNKYKDLQRRVINAQLQNLVLNAADATIRGAEVEVTLLATDRWAIRASGGYLDAQYSSFDGLDVNGDGVPDPDLAKNLLIPNVPKWTRYIDVRHDLPLGTLGTLTFWASYGFVDKTFADDANRLPLNAYELVDGSITYAPTGSNFKVSAFGKNLTDKVYTKFAVRSALFDYRYAEPPRTLGIEFSYEF